MESKPDYRIVIDQRGSPSYRIANVQINGRGLAYAGASPTGKTPEEFLDSFNDYQKSFERDFIFIDRHGWRYLENSHEEVMRIREAVKENTEVNFNYNDYQYGNIFSPMPPDHYRIGFDVEKSAITVFQIHEHFIVGSEGEINGAGCFSYTPEDFIDDWNLYKNSLKMCVFITRENPGSGFDIVEADLPFTLSEWRFAYSNKALESSEFLSQIENSDCSKSAAMSVKLSEEVKFSLTFFLNPDQLRGGFIINKHLITRAQNNTAASDTLCDETAEYVIDRYQNLGIPYYLVNSPASSPASSEIKVER